jgi:hypothetical protein
VQVPIAECVYSNAKEFTRKTKKGDNVSFLKSFQENDRIQELLNQMSDDKCYAVQYKAPRDYEFTDISASPRDIYTLEHAEKNIQRRQRAKGYRRSTCKVIKISYVRR